MLCNICDFSGYCFYYYYYRSAMVLGACYILYFCCFISLIDGCSFFFNYSGDLICDFLLSCNVILPNVFILPSQNTTPYFILCLIGSLYFSCASCLSLCQKLISFSLTLLYVVFFFFSYIVSWPNILIKMKKNGLFQITSLDFIFPLAFLVFRG